MREKPFKNKMPALIKRRFEETALFFYIMGVTDALPSVTDTAALRLFYKKMGISPDDWDEDSARREFIRMKHEYLRL